MDIAYQIASYLQTAGYGTLASNIFVGQIPADTDGIYVMRSGGSLNGYSAIESTILDIYIRDTSASTAITTIEGIKRYIHRMHSTQTSGANIYSMLVVSDVEDIARDSELNKVFKISVEVMHRALTAIS